MQQVLEFAAEVNLGDVVRRKVAPAVLVPAHTGQGKSSVNTGMVIMRRTVAIALAPRINQWLACATRSFLFHAQNQN